MASNPQYSTIVEGQPGDVHLVEDCVTHLHRLLQYRGVFAREISNHDDDADDSVCIDAEAVI
mgnify:CR=1 FL=1|tara:strand:- start:343 stop:528 length:186 start_codon:yes stop_codon:yes gene_type:complete